METHRTLPRLGLFANSRIAVLTGAVLILATSMWPDSVCVAQERSASDRDQAQRSRRSQRVVPMQAIEVVSPNGKVQWTLLPNAERLTIQVSLDETTVIEPSPIEMRLDGYDLSAGVVFRGLDRYQIQETYPWHGNQSTATNACHGARIALRNDLSLDDYTLEIRAFNDGVAYRHIIPGDETASRVADESSAFVLPEGATVWYAGLSAGHYEDTYEKKDISEVPPGEWAGPPLTFQLPDRGIYAAITEANLVNYSGMGLEADGRRGWRLGLGHRHPLNYPFELRYGREEAKRLGKPAAIPGTVTTPWRVVLIGRDLHTLVNSTILPNLCPPPDPALFPEGIHTDWIRPGRAVWRYVDGGGGGVEGMNEFSRMAGELGFEHHVIEGFWSRWSVEERQEVVDYSKQQGVGVWFWKHSRDLRTPEAREAFFQMLRDLGVAGAKIDFFDHEHKELIDLYETLLREAAAHRVSLVFHGANKPTGRERTWPNEAVREAIKGMESSRLTERARHQTILPFTRYLAGPADYTALIFSRRRGDTTWANQIASLAILNSPLLTIAAHPQSILDNPAVEVIKAIPAIWDETLVLPESEIGELAGYARRAGSIWFVAAMCGPRAKSIQVPLSFLDERQYRATFVRDGAEDASVSVEPGTVDRSRSLDIDLKSGGGFVARFIPN